MSNTCGVTYLHVAAEKRSCFHNVACNKKINYALFMNSVQFDTKYLFVIKHCVQNNSTYDVARILRRS